jgi:hypothetical protein
MILIKYSSVTGQKQSNGNFILQAYGSPGETFDLQASTNLQTWQDLGSVIADTNGVALFEDTNAPPFPQPLLLHPPAVSAGTHGGGNSFALRNFITNNAEEGVETSGSYLHISLLNRRNSPAETWLAKLREKRILVRRFAAPETKDFLRITIGTDAQSDALLKAVRSILNKQL